MKSALRLLQFTLWALPLGFALQGSQLYAQSLETASDWYAADHLDLRLHARVEDAQTASLTIGVELIPEPGWHIYWKNPGDTGLPTKISWLEGGVEAGEIQWPSPERADYQGFINYGYYQHRTLIQEFTNAEELLADSAKLSAQIDWLICEEICIPGRARLSLDLANLKAVPMGSVSLMDTAIDQIPGSMGLLEGQYSFSGGLLQIEAALPTEYQSAEILDYFPVSAGLVENTAQPSIENRDGTLLISQTSKSRLPDLPNRYSGLLQLQTSDGARWLEFQVEAADGLISSSPPQTAVAGVSLALALILAFLGGIILNLMPCVLPVLSLKAMQLVESRENAQQRRVDALAYTLGILLSFAAIALILIGLREGGQQIGWGFQLQNPAFVGFLVALLFLLGLALSGFVELGSSLTRVGNWVPAGQGPVKSFGTGLLATLVATPCTAPFMGVAMGAALTMSLLPALMIFLALGLGLAFPMLLMGMVPGATRLLPRPGAWMQTLKEILAFPLYLSAIWLLWVYSTLTSSDATALLLVGLLVMVFGLWLSRGAHRSGSRLAGLAGLLFLLIGLFSPPLLPKPGTDSPGEVEMAFDEALISAALANGQPVFVNVTADWCISCKVNERVALKSKEVQRFFEEEEVLYLIADWTRVDPHITEFLDRFGRSGVPLYLVYLPGQGEPKILPQILTPGLVMDAFAG